MQTNGGFFGSMGSTPAGATSFMPQDGAPNPASMTPTGMNPQALAQLMAMFAAAGNQNGQNGQSGQSGQPGSPTNLPPGSTLAPGATSNGPPAQPVGGPMPQGGQQNGIAQALQSLSKLDPVTLKGILSRLSIGARPNPNAAPLASLALPGATPAQ